MIDTDFVDLMESEESSVLLEGLFGEIGDGLSKGERALITAILENAIRDATRKPIKSVSCPRRTALDWLHITSPLTEADITDPFPFTFVWVADILGMDYKWLHKKIKQCIPLVAAKTYERKRIR